MGVSDEKPVIEATVNENFEESPSADSGMSGRYCVEYTYTTQHLTEYYQSFLSTASTGSFWGAMVVVYINVLFAVLAVVFATEPIGLLWFNITVGGTVCIFLIATNFPKIVRWWSIVRKVPQDKILMNLDFDSGGVFVKTDDRVRVPYEDIKAVHYYKKNIFLVHNNNNPIIVPNVEFALGDFAGLGKFLQSHLECENNLTDENEAKEVRRAVAISVVVLGVLPVIYFWVSRVL